MFSVWALAPAFFDKTVNEDFPVVAGPAPTSQWCADPVPSTSAAGSGVVTSAPATVPAVAPTTVAAPTEPVRLAAGTFSGLAGHEGTGDAVLYRLPDGSDLVRLENLDLQTPPGGLPRVGPCQTELDGAVEPRRPEGNKATRTPCPPTSPDAVRRASKWCRAFSVEFAGAPFAVV